MWNWTPHNNTHMCPVPDGKKAYIRYHGESHKDAVHYGPIPHDELMKNSWKQIEEYLIVEDKKNE